MKTLSLFLVLVVTSIGVAQEKKVEANKMKATTLHGYVVDQMCAKAMAKKNNPMERAARHTRECALEEACAASGYGLFYEDGKWIKFDEKGDKLAQEMFDKSKRDRDFTVAVTGVVKGDRLAVTTLVEEEMSKSEKESKE